MFREARPTHRSGDLNSQSAPVLQSSAVDSRQRPSKPCSSGKRIQTNKESPNNTAITTECTTHGRPERLFSRWHALQLAKRNDAYTSEYETRTSVFVLVVGKRNGKREQPVGKLLGRRFSYVFLGQLTKEGDRGASEKPPRGHCYITAISQRGGVGVHSAHGCQRRRWRGRCGGSQSGQISAPRAIRSTPPHLGETVSFTNTHAHTHCRHTALSRFGGQWGEPSKNWRDDRPGGRDSGETQLTAGLLGEAGRMAWMTRKRREERTLAEKKKTSSIRCAPGRLLAQR